MPKSTSLDEQEIQRRVVMTVEATNSGRSDANSTSTVASNVGLSPSNPVPTNEFFSFGSPDIVYSVRLLEIHKLGNELQEFKTNEGQSYFVVRLEYKCEVASEKTCSPDILLRFVTKDRRIKGHTFRIGDPLPKYPSLDNSPSFGGVSTTGWIYLIGPSDLDGAFLITDGEMGMETVYFAIPKE